MARCKLSHRYIRSHRYVNFIFSLLFLQNGGVLVYYEQRPYYPNETLYAFPDGFQMVAGNPRLTTYGANIESEGMSFACIDYKNPTAETHAFPQKNCPQGIIVNIIKLDYFKKMHFRNIFSYGSFNTLRLEDSAIFSKVHYY